MSEVPCPDLYRLAEDLGRLQAYGLRRASNRPALRRVLEYRALRGQGWSLQAIGDREGISRERVRQVLDHGAGLLPHALEYDLAHLPPEPSAEEAAIILWRQLDPAWCDCPECSTSWR